MAANTLHSIAETPAKKARNPFSALCGRIEASMKRDSKVEMTASAGNAGQTFVRYSVPEDKGGSKDSLSQPSITIPRGPAL